MKALMTSGAKYTKSLDKGVLRDVKDWKCGRNGCEYNKPVIVSSGYSNQFRHLQSCYGAGKLNELYEKAVAEQARLGGSVAGYFNANSATSRHKAIYAYIKLIVMKSLPLAYVQDDFIRDFSKFPEHISKKTIREVIFVMVELVEKAIAEELSKTSCGAIMHDGWSRGGTHYVGLFGCYIRLYTVREHNTEVTKEEPVCTLLAVSPMAKVEERAAEGEDSEDEVAESEDGQDVTMAETAVFNAEAHKNFFETTFKDCYGIDLKKWNRASITDNTSTNLRLARLMDVPHVGCKNHQLNLDVELMVQGHDNLKLCIESVHETMRSCKQSIKNAALLRNLTPLAPTIQNKTRWSGIDQMMLRWIRLHQELIEVANDPSSRGVTMNDSPAFLRSVKKFSTSFGQINEVTKFLQTSCIPLSKARLALDGLNAAVRRNNRVVGSNFYGCQFKCVKSAADSDLCPNPHFESGVVKIQLGKIDELTDLEKTAVASLRRTPVKEGQDANEAPDGSPTMKQRMEQLRQAPVRAVTATADSQYVNCEFIYGSSAEVERLWSVAGYVLTAQRMGMTPQMLEAILFLKLNSRFWGLELCVRAISMVKSDMALARIQADIEQTEMAEEMALIDKEGDGDF